MRHKRTLVLLAVLMAVVAASATAPLAAAGGIAGDNPTGAAQSVETDQTPSQSLLETQSALTQEAVSCEYPLELTDATGETITLEEAPDSVVALQASDAQTMYEIGAEDRLDGMPYSDATSGLDRGDRADVGDGWTVDHEQIIATDPDLVLAANATQAEDIETLRDEADFTVYHFPEAESIDDVRENVETTGALVDECDGADDTVDWMDDQLEIVETALEDADRPLVYYTMGDDGMTAGTGTFIGDILSTAGLENVAEDAGITWYEPINAETVVDADPEWVVYPDDREEPPIPDAASEITAVEEDNVIAVDANRLNQPAPQVVLAVTSIVEEIHPEAYDEASAELEGSAASDDDGAGAGDDEDGEATTDDGDAGDDSIPGFGVAGALAAVLATLGLGARLR
ncbi:ABC-type transport system periplasmic substrate-binding protein (probable substrate cobalamin) [Natrialba magadii ATCC 43099]|uniref:ABC-type transport system periplasmic substrate-binding protein (Probable substrate cobalamin) n=1 Tax=Natrialba magadii (strain ATCC 43099 / DSM 3394 / CCM 3739 / CIP 104546 / IAM 13178 / JCM 8861 / NBRC 102185 / NCIMB 2190 / MS3) TaxID=547559 RepID=D3SU66_NATMM|nr:PGF-CTERM-anchored ABC transporter substrate-binding protein [Natrialba magadii]ADD07155.1 ABC-type transport system periplasmic substrate-binding protein (probable substrate cobalamin) [Natrialba magadii ATCC 43099]ELY29069.1 periplasmic binding protein [Natrialba magadii ATCC 43099]